MDKDPRLFFKRRQIEVGRVPLDILARARRLILALERGLPYWKLRGKRLVTNRAVISFPIGRRWRILAEEQAGQIVPKQVLSHQSYDRKL